MIMIIYLKKFDQLILFENVVYIHIKIKIKRKHKYIPLKKIEF